MSECTNHVDSIHSNFVISRNHWRSQFGATKTERISQILSLCYHYTSPQSAHSRIRSECKSAAHIPLCPPRYRVWRVTSNLLPRLGGAFDLRLAVSVPLPIVMGIFVLLWFQSRLTESCKEIVCNIFIHRWSGDYYFCTWIISLAVL